MKAALVTLNYKDEAGCTEVCRRAKECRCIDWIIIVDNNSGDGSYEALKKFEDDKIKVVQTGKNGGYSFGYNYGFTLAKKLGADKVILCNSDVLFDEEMISACIRCLEENPIIGAVSTRQKNIDQVEVTSAWTYPQYWNEIKFCFYFFRKFILSKQNEDVYPVKDKMQEVDVLAGCFSVYQMEALEKCGMYDENVFLYNEENIISKRLHNTGYTLCRLNDYFYIHAHSRKPGKLSTDFKKLLQTAMCSYYFQVTYQNIGVIKKLFFKLCILCGTFEKWCLNNLQVMLDKIREK